MGEWEKIVQIIVEEVDRCIKNQDNDTLTLSRLARKLGYSEFYISRKFRVISGMHLGSYIMHLSNAHIDI